MSSSDDAMPSHEDIVADEAREHEPEAEAEAHEEAAPEDDWDIKNRNI